MQHSYVSYVPMWFKTPKPLNPKLLNIQTPKLFIFASQSN
jgi:hypothetical protein